MARFSTTCLYFASLLALAGCASTATQEPLTSSAFSQPNTAAKSDIKILGTLPHGLTLETRPDEYVTDYVTVVAEPAWAEYVPVPSEYQWMEGEIKGVEKTYVPEQLGIETVTDRIIFQEARTELLSRPALYVKNGTVVETAEVIERVVPAITKEVEVRVRKSTAGPVMERTTPYEFKDGKTRVPVKTFPPKEKIHPAITQQIAKRKLISPQTYIIKDETGQIIHRFKTRDELKAFLE